VPNAEHRQYPRVFLPTNAGVTGHFEKYNGSLTKFPAVVMNLSQGGIGVATRRQLSGQVLNGDQLTLSVVKRNDSSTPIRGITTVVQWVLEEPTSDKLVLGLEFSGVDPLMRGVIGNFMEMVGG
jgi:c-di-GMP-binding flagellar brake protein YcgR